MGLFLYIITTFSSLLYFMWDIEIDGAGSAALTYPLSLACVLTPFFTFLIWRSRTKSSFDILTLFLLSQIFFLAGHQILHVLGLSDVVGGILNGISTVNTINMSFLMIFTSFVFFGLGSMLMTLRKRSSKKPQQENQETTTDGEEKACAKTGFLLLAISFVPFIICFVWYMRVVSGAGYAAIYDPSNAQGGFMRMAFILMQLIVPGSIFLIASGKKNKKGRALLGVAAIILYTMMNFLVGTRGHAIMPVLAAAWIWHKRISPIPTIPAFFSGLFMVFVVFPVIAVLRGARLADKTTLDAFISAYEGINNPAIQILDEMGKSGLRITAWVYELVPSVRDYDFGLSYLYALFSLVPNFWGGEHISSAERLSLWITKAIRPEWATVGGGFGFSYLGEAYLNFGWFGVVVISFFLGSFIAKGVVRLSEKKSILYLAFIGCIAAIITFYPRAETQQIIRNLVWYSVLPYWLSLYFYRPYRKRVAKKKGILYGQDQKKLMIRIDKHNTKPQ